MANWGQVLSNVDIGDTPVKNRYGATAPPAGTDDSNSGYGVGSMWVDSTNDKAYVCSDASVGAAVWTEITGGGGGGVSFPLLAPDGSAAAPSYSFTNSTNTGLYLASASQINMSLRGTDVSDWSSTDLIPGTWELGAMVARATTATGGAGARIVAQSTYEPGVLFVGDSEVIQMNATRSGFSNSAQVSCNVNESLNFGDVDIQCSTTATSRVQITGNALRVNTTNLGFFSATAIPKPTVAGSRGGNVALANLLTELANLGLVTDSTIA